MRQVPQALLEAPPDGITGIAMALRFACRVLVLILLLVLAPGAVVATARADVVLDARRYSIKAGRYSPFQKFQVRLNEIIDSCGRNSKVRVPNGELAKGMIGANTRAALIEALKCPELASVSHSGPARDGVITDAVWRAVMKTDEVPGVFDRAKAMVLSFEATDYGAPPEWNLCQDGMVTAADGSLQCYNTSDPCSYLTWGPRGATAGAGREIQLVLGQLEREDPEQLRRLFGTEYQQLSRFFSLRAGNSSSCEGPVPLKVFMCAIWMTPKRKAIWDRALTRLGASPEARRVYELLYSAHEFDGAKIANFVLLWKELGLYTSEIDYAFFLDRATHQGGPPAADDETLGALRRCMQGERGAVSRHGSARRCLSRLQPHKTQLKYRLARDVAYYLDAYEEGALQEPEIKAWSGYMPLSAAYNFGLRDDVPVEVPLSRPLAELGIEAIKDTAEDVTEGEMRLCPASVLTPRRTRRP